MTERVEIEHRFRCAVPALDVRIGSTVTLDGRILARHCAAGAGDAPPGRAAAGPYAIGDVTGAAPASGGRALVWACESHTDLLARQLGLDPFDLRRRNLDPQGAATAALDALQSRMRWRGPFERTRGALKRGRGIALDVDPVPRGVGAEVAIDPESGLVQVTRLIVADLVTADDLTLDAAHLIEAALTGGAIPDLDRAPAGLAAAIVNAIDEAIGVRLTALPLTPAAVRSAWRALVGGAREQA